MRSSGILLHPTSLPGPFGIGDLGPEAEKFLEFTQRGGLTTIHVTLTHSAATAIAAPWP